MIKRYCDMCDQEESKDNEVIVGWGYYGIERDICEKCKIMVDKSIKKRFDSIFEDAQKDIKKARGIT